MILEAKKLKPYPVLKTYIFRALKIWEEYQTSENGVGGIKSMAVQLYTPLEYSEII